MQMGKHYRHIALAHNAVAVNCRHDPGEVAWKHYEITPVAVMALQERQHSAALKLAEQSNKLLAHGRLRQQLLMYPSCTGRNCLVSCASDFSFNAQICLGDLQVLR